MIIKPKARGFICTTAHPIGCKENVRRQIGYVKEKGAMEGPKKVLVIGASTGYGLASRIAAAFGCGAATIGVMFEKEASGKRTATPGFYNTRAFEEFAEEEGIYAKSVNGDAFSKEVKEQVISMIKEELGEVDMVIYSLAAPRRTMADGTVYNSVLKTVDKPFTNKSLDLKDNTIVEASIGPANEDEVASTIKVMGGEDWYDWMHALKENGVLAQNAVTMAYSYIGPELTYPVYFDGTIGQAKRDLKEKSDAMNRDFADMGLRSFVSVNKALVTQASAAIPVVPLYFAILYKVMKELGNHEGCIEQIDRLFREKLLADTVEVDEEGRIRMDDYEMEERVQSEVMRRWDLVNTENLLDIADIDGYWDDFYQMFGFRMPNVDYSLDVEP